MCFVIWREGLALERKKLLCFNYKRKKKSEKKQIEMSDIL